VFGFLTATGYSNADVNLSGIVSMADANMIVERNAIPLYMFLPLLLPRNGNILQLP